VQADASVVSLDGATSFSAVDAQPWDWGHQIMGVMIGGACDSVNNGGADIAGYDRHSDGTFSHMTTWAQQPDGGYAWQPQNCGQNGACSASPRESFDAGNYIVQTKYNAALTPKSGGGGTPAPPTPAPVTTPTTAKAKASTARSTPRTNAAPATTAAPAATPAPAATATTVDAAPTTASADTATTTAPAEAALRVPSKPTSHSRGVPGTVIGLATAVLLAAAGGSVVARRRQRRANQS
jgi:hypothetical protein